MKEVPGPVAYRPVLSPPPPAPAGGHSLIRPRRVRQVCAAEKGMVFRVLDEEGLLSHLQGIQFQF